LKFLLDENVPISIKDLIRELGFDVFTLHDFNKLGIQNGEVAKLALKEKAIIITLDADFLQLNKNLQKQSRIIYVKIHPRNPKKIRELLNNSLKTYVSKLNNPCKLIIAEDDIILDELK
jgi:predicted nuclease of predicted toxin-antitoxin system